MDGTGVIKVEFNFGITCRKRNRKEKSIAAVVFQSRYLGFTTFLQPFICILRLVFQ